jgi:hypothetical protein
MCESREEKFVIPTKPSAKMGWWIGYVLRIDGIFYQINILWAQVAACNTGDNVIYSTQKYLREFDNAVEAMDCLRSEGAIPEPKY